MRTELSQALRGCGAELGPTAGLVGAVGQERGDRLWAGGAAGRNERHELSCTDDNSIVTICNTPGSCLCPWSIHP